jgi:large subunit ribosomal protein L31
MKSGIHPKYYPEAQVICACGNTWTTGATEEEIRTDVCSACHPFYTGEQRIVDTAGQVERFMRRLEKKVEIETEAPEEAEA